ncbi:unnamed protein product [Symbiodinium pilosum]|uniref:PHD and RING finger domain-containing protein 1 n=1 Tax=Symbiodinium pilosum TaxID=2952 RepID=A0A812THH6_SYMPI|nr:unnamed protein product [Symbiodinium pilosum]
MEDVGPKLPQPPQPERLAFACPICQEHVMPASASQVASCSHRFCSPCIERWAASCSSCPLCKREMGALLPLRQRGREKGSAPPKRRLVPTRQLEVSVDEALDGFEDCCQVCGGSQDAESLLLCDGCDAGYHTFCVGLSAVPAGDWYCERCEEDRSTRRLDLGRPPGRHSFLGCGQHRKRCQHGGVRQAKLAVGSVACVRAWRLERKLLEPQEESVSEEASVRSQANENETLPRIEGDNYSLSDEPERGDTSGIVKSCLESSLSLKQAVKDETIDPLEMKTIMAHLGRCASGGSSLIKHLFTDQDSTFTFHGQMPGSDKDKKLAMRPWAEADEACLPAAERAPGASSPCGPEIVVHCRRLIHLNTPEWQSSKQCCEETRQLRVCNHSLCVCQSQTCF